MHRKPSPWIGRIITPERLHLSLAATATAAAGVMWFNGVDHVATTTPLAAAIVAMQLWRDHRAERRRGHELRELRGEIRRYASAFEVAIKEMQGAHQVRLERVVVKAFDLGMRVGQAEAVWPSRSRIIHSVAVKPK